MTVSLLAAQTTWQFEPMVAAALARRTRHGERLPGLAAYNAYLASLEAPEA